MSKYACVWQCAILDLLHLSEQQIHICAATANIKAWKVLAFPVCLCCMLPTWSLFACNPKNRIVFKIHNKSHLSLFSFPLKVGHHFMAKTTDSSGHHTFSEALHDASHSNIPNLRISCARVPSRSHPVQIANVVCCNVEEPFPFIKLGMCWSLRPGCLFWKIIRVARRRMFIFCMHFCLCVFWGIQSPGWGL